MRRDSAKLARVVWRAMPAETPSAVHTRAWWRWVLAAAVGATGLILCPVASAAPHVTFKAAFVPIPGVAHTGNVPDAGAAVQLEYEIEGEEYGGSPPPLVGLNLYLPEGTVLHAGGFTGCPRATLEMMGPAGCPGSSVAGPIGSAAGIVSVSSERVAEAATLEPFDVELGGIDFYIAGRSPASFDAIASGHYVHLNGAGGYGPELITEVPLITTVTGARLVSLQSIDTTFDTMYQAGAEPIYYVTVPSTCPGGTGLPIKSELFFDEDGDVPIAPETVLSHYTLPCPQAPEPEALAPAASSPSTPTPTAQPSPPSPRVGAHFVVAPSKKTCVSRRGLRVHVEALKGVAYREVSAYVGQHRARVIRKASSGAIIALHHLPSGRYIVKVVAITRSGRRITWRREYHACSKRAKGRP